MYFGVNGEIHLDWAPWKSSYSLPPPPWPPASPTCLSLFHHVFLSWVLQAFCWMISNIPPGVKNIGSPGLPFYLRMTRGRDWEGRDSWDLTVGEWIPKTAKSCPYLVSPPTLAPAEPTAWWGGLEGPLRNTITLHTFTSTTDSYFSGRKRDKWSMGISWWPFQRVFLGPSQRQRCKLMWLLRLHLHLLSHVPSVTKSQAWGLTVNHLPPRSHCSGFFQKGLTDSWLFFHSDCGSLSFPVTLTPNARL